MSKSSVVTEFIATGVLVEAIEGIDALGTTAMPARTAAKICRIINWGRPLHAGYTAERNEIVNRYGISMGEGKFNIPQEKVQVFNNAMRRMQTELTAPLPSDLALTLDDLSGFSISPAQISRIMLFVLEM